MDRKVAFASAGRREGSSSPPCVSESQSLDVPKSRSTHGGALRCGMQLLRPCIALLPALSLIACSSNEGRNTNGESSGVATLDTGATESGDSNTSNTTNTTSPKLDVAADDEDLPSATTGDCVSETLDPEVVSIPVDILLVVDTSFSMAPAIGAVQNSINVDFAQILEQSGIDYQVIVLGGLTDTQVPICISSPLSNTDCNPPPPVPAINDHYKHYDAETGSGAFLTNILAWYATPDKHGLAPGGYQDFLRPEATKVFLGMTDGTSASGNPADGDAFDAGLLALQPPVFGTPGDRQYKFHLIVEAPVNAPADAPWLPQDPIVGNAGSLEQVAIVSGGWRFPLSQTQSFSVLFQEVAEDVIATTPIACEFPIPRSTDGGDDRSRHDRDRLLPRQSTTRGSLPPSGRPRGVRAGGVLHRERHGDLVPGRVRARARRRDGQTRRALWLRRRLRSAGLIVTGTRRRVSRPRAGAGSSGRIFSLNSRKCMSEQTQWM